MGPQVIIKLNTNVSQIKCEKDNQIYLNDFEKDSQFVCREYLQALVNNKTYIATTNDWDKIHFPEEVCDVLEVVIPRN